MEDSSSAQNSPDSEKAQQHDVTLILQPLRGSASERKTYLLVIGAVAACLFPVILIVCVGLWPYREYVGLGGAGLFVLAVVAILYIRIRQTEASAYAVTTQAKVSRDEQTLRHQRLKPNQSGYYEIPLTGGMPLWIPENLSPVHTPLPVPKPGSYPDEEHYYHPQHAPKPQQ
jgi:uncharacterized membrane protein